MFSFAVNKFSRAAFLRTGTTLKGSFSRQLTKRARVCHSFLSRRPFAAGKSVMKHDYSIRIKRRFSKFTATLNGKLSYWMGES
jgi:hypothetical protein